MRRIGAHYLYVNPTTILLDGVVELSDKEEVIDFFSLRNLSVETSKTLFFSGILSPAFVSLKQHIHIPAHKTLMSSYQYIDFSSQLFDIQLSSEQEFVFDFDDLSLPEIKKRIIFLQQENPSISLFDIIRAASFLPEEIINQNRPGIVVSKKMPIWLFENIDLKKKTILPESNIRVV